MTVAKTATKSAKSAKPESSNKPAAKAPREVPQVTNQRMFIDGRFVDSVSGKTFPTLNPATGDVNCQIAEGDKNDIDLAVKARAGPLKPAPGRK